MFKIIKTNHKICLLLLATWLINQSVAALSLIEVVHYVLETHPTILANENTVDSFQYRYYQTFGQFLPEISYRNDLMREINNNAPSGINEKRYLNARTKDFEFRQNLFSGFKDFNANRAALWRYVSTKENASYNINATVLDSIISYIIVLQQTKFLEIAIENQNFFQKALNNLEKLFMSGATDKADYLLVKNNLENAKATLVQSKKDYDSAVAKFQYTINLTPTNLLPLKSVSKYVDYDLDRIINLVLQHNPAIQEAHAKLKSLDYDLRGVVSSMLPSVDMVISKTQAANIAGLAGKMGDTKIGITSNLNIFRGGQDYLETKTKTSEKNSQARQIEAIVRVIKQDIYETVLNITNALQKKHSLEEQIKTAEQSLSSYLILFDYNQSYLLNVLNAKKLLFTSQTDNIANNSAKLVNEHKLLMLMNNLIATLEEVYSFSNNKYAIVDN